MFIIKAPNDHTGIMWGLIFVNGEAKTDDEILARKLENKGYIVTSDGDVNDDDKSFKKTPPKYGGLKRLELDALALERNIDISGCNTKEMVLALLLEYDEAVANEQQE